MLTHAVRAAPDGRPPAPVVNPHVPPRLPLAFKLLLVCAVALVMRITVFIRQRSGEQYDAVDLSAAIQIAIVAVTLILFLVVMPALRDVWTRVVGSSVRLWLWSLGLGMVSAAWSIHPSYSLFRALEVLSQSLILLLVVGGTGPWWRAERLTLGLAWLALVLDVAGNYRLTGGFAGGVQSNSFSAMAGMIAAYSLAEALEASGRRRSRLLLGGLLALAVLVAGASLASWWAFLVGMVVASLMAQRGVALLVPALLLVLLVVLAGDDALQSLLMRNKPTEQLATLHGRTILWTHFWDVYKERPLLGYGYAIGARTQGVVYTTNTHNAVLSVLLGCGALGLLVSAAMGGRLACELWVARRARAVGASGAVALAVTAFVNSMSLAFLGEAWMPATFVFMCFFAFFVLHVRPGVGTGARTGSAG